MPPERRTGRDFLQHLMIWSGEFTLPHPVLRSQWRTHASNYPVLGQVMTAHDDPSDQNRVR
jgi:hypothetical protein